MDGRPVYIVFAGVNGAGKSTLFRSDLWRTGSEPATLARVNPDEIVASSGGSWSSAQDNLSAGKEALRLINAYIAAGTSFTHETTLAGRSTLKFLNRAKDQGFSTCVYYVGVADTSVALSRIAHRVEVGGHDIDESLVRRRYDASLKNLSKVIRMADEVHVYDNTDYFKHLAAWRGGTLRWWGDARTNGSWLPRAMADDAVWAG